MGRHGNRPLQALLLLIGRSGITNTKIEDQAISFPVEESSSLLESLEALAEVREMKEHPERYHGYTDLDQMMKDLTQSETNPT